MSVTDYRRPLLWLIAIGSIAESQYAVKDEETEKKYHFDLADALDIGVPSGKPRVSEELSGESADAVRRLQEYCLDLRLGATSKAAAESESLSAEKAAAHATRESASAAAAVSDGQAQA